MQTETITILLVEDNSADVRLVQEMLRDVKAFQFQLIHASRLAEALSYIAANTLISAILLDWSLPDTRGLDAVTQIRLASPDIPIIVMSDSYDEADGDAIASLQVPQAIQQGAQDYLIKGQVDGEVLVRSIRYAIARQSASTHERLRSALANQEAEEAGSLVKSEFLATMSHELRTPLNTILGLGELILQEDFGPLNEKQKKYLTSIQSSGEHLLALINDILDLSEVEAGKEKLDFVSLDVREVCHRCLAMVRQQASERGLKLTLDINPQARICVADERRCQQMLLNLLSNAVKFTPKGEVSLIVTKLPEKIAFTVKDTGIGIPSEKLPLLFEPFRQLDSGLNRRFPGTGLGLALTRSLAWLHGGDVMVRSTVGQGSEFTLYLPDDPPLVKNEG